LVLLTRRKWPEAVETMKVETVIVPGKNALRVPP
jgi:hypothetical protein